MTSLTWRVGGVREPFNLPWILAAEERALAHLDLELEFVDFAGGTGALVAAIEDGSVDLATLLTEGAVTAVCRGRGVRLHSAFTETPLVWGVHVAAGATERHIDQLADRRFAISRFGSGSELMAYVLAGQRGWELDPEQFVVVGGLDGALEALPGGGAEIFLWERFVTAPFVRRGAFRRLDDLVADWPAFYTAGRPSLIDTDRTLVDKVVEIVLDRAAALAADPDAAVAQITGRYDMSDDDVRAWLRQVRWATAPAVDRDMLASTMDTMAELGRIDAPIAVEDLL